MANFAEVSTRGDVEGTQRTGPAISPSRHARSAEVAGELERALAQLNQQTPLWQSFLAAHRQIVKQLADEMLREHQLPLEWFDVLVHLADLPGMRARQKELRDRMLLSESGVSRLLVRMEKAGVITRSTADDDRRGIEIAVTDDGRAALLAAIESHLQLVARVQRSPDGDRPRRTQPGTVQAPRQAAAGL